MATWIWAIDPDNMSGFNTNCNFISDTWSFKLVREPSGAKIQWFLDVEVSTINTDKTSLQHMTVNEPVVPFHL